MAHPVPPGLRQAGDGAALWSPFAAAPENLSYEQIQDGQRLIKFSETLNGFEHRPSSTARVLRAWEGLGLASSAMLRLSPAMRCRRCPGIYRRPFALTDESGQWPDPMLGPPRRRRRASGVRRGVVGRSMLAWLALFGKVLMGVWGRRRSGRCRPSW